MTENYLDPNSGAAPQPGGVAAAPAVTQDDQPTDVGADMSSLVPEETAPLVPAGNAKREDWVAYARAQGAPQDELESQEEGGLSRDQLRDAYGA
jgi:hypothetical protein